MNKKLRLKVTDACQRNCAGCCNKDYPDVPKFDFATAKRYEEVYLTGGEPLIDPAMTKAVASFFSSLGADVFVYSSKCLDDKDLSIWRSLLKSCGVVGITFTIHEEKDIHEFQRLDRWIHAFYGNCLSLRLNLFDHFKMDYKPRSNWRIKKIEWVKDCPIPTGEDFRRI